MDVRAERLLVEQLLAARPDDAVLGEESGAGSGTSGVRWVLDPIDGT
jgi:myo-inositol-1(or 4)-monophosphatase